MSNILTNEHTIMSELYTQNKFEKLDEIKSLLSKKPPIVKLEEIESLKRNLEEVFFNKKFIIQFGDCAEKFNQKKKAITLKKLQFTNAIYQTFNNRNLSVILIARMAGQFAKPRSKLTEDISGESCPLYFGDMYNDSKHISSLRSIDPSRIIDAYKASKKIYDDSKNLLMQKITGIDLANFFFSHEALNIHYEECLTKEYNNSTYNLSTHFPWLGLRTLTSKRHTDYLQKIANPIGIKIGPETDIGLILELLEKLNPKNEVNKIVLILRLGVKNIKNKLPFLISNIQRQKSNVIWMCDAVHGNALNINNYRVRNIEDIIEEICLSNEIHQIFNSKLGGIHLETSHENLTECVGYNVNLDDVHKNYQSPTDPRLNYDQTLFVMNKIVEKCFI